MGPRPKRHLSDLEFDRAANTLEMKPELRVAAYRYMVDRHTFTRVSEESGLHDRSIQRKVREIWEVHCNLPPLPPDWVTELVSLPRPEMKEIKLRSKKLLKIQEGH